MLNGKRNIKDISVEEMNANPKLALSVANHDPSDPRFREMDPEVLFKVEPSHPHARCVVTGGKVGLYSGALVISGVLLSTADIITCYWVSKTGLLAINAEGIHANIRGKVEYFLSLGMLTPEERDQYIQPLPEGEIMVDAGGPLRTFLGRNGVMFNNESLAMVNQTMQGMDHPPDSIFRRLFANIFFSRSKLKCELAGLKPIIEAHGANPDAHELIRQALFAFTHDDAYGNISALFLLPGMPDSEALLNSLPRLFWSDSNPDVLKDLRIALAG